MVAAIAATQARGSLGLDDLIAIHRAERTASAVSMLRADPGAAGWLDPSAARGRWVRAADERTAPGAGCSLRGGRVHRHLVDRSGTRLQKSRAEVEPGIRSVGASGRTLATRS